MQKSTIFSNPYILTRTLIVRFLAIIFSLLFSNNQVFAQKPRELFGLSSKAQKKGDFITAERYLMSILGQKENIKEKNLVAVYNELGVINKSLGRYHKAVEFYFKGEKIVLSNLNDLGYKLPSLYNNLGNVFKINGDFKKAQEYFDESLSIIELSGLSNRKKVISKAHANNNLGLVYYLQADFKTALKYFRERLDLGINYNLEGLDIVYNNYANCLRELRNYKKATEYYEKSISICFNTFGNDYYRLAYVCKDYGKLKTKEKKYDEAYNLYKKALELSKLNFGNKHPYTAEIHEVIGDYYLSLSNYNKALEYYQLSLISNSENFNTTVLSKNPQSVDVFSKIQLLRSLKKKVNALISLVNKENENNKSVETLNLCITTIDRAVQVIQDLRQGYNSLESKLYITANEKELYMTGIENALKLYEISKNEKYLKKAYQFSSSSKAAVLLEEIKQNEAMAANIPDSLIIKKKNVLQNIAAYQKLIFDENQKHEPNIDMLKQWRSKLFYLNKSYENLLKSLSRSYPIYSHLLERRGDFNLSNVQSRLGKDDVLIEYSYFTNKNKGKLYAFVINKDQINYHSSDIDSTFEEQIDDCHKKMNQSMGVGSFSSLQEYNLFNQKLFSLYILLIKPHKLSKNANIIIVPDEKIAYLSFDALISDYNKEPFINYGGLPYLLYDYRFSYAYSSSLLFMQTETEKFTNRVFAFAPIYHSGNESKMRNLNGELKNANTEIESILDYFEGVTFVGDVATKENFTTNLKHKGIYHLAMHANSAENHHEYSYLAFSQLQGKKQSPLMYNYEISNIPMKASMLVLSACNTGDGNVYSGEGVMSLSRNFILAGIQSVVHGLWRINDESSSVIMGDFYKYLADGKSKGEALQLAKINYVENASPELANPKYWAGLVIMGNKAPLVKNVNYTLYIIVGLLILSLVAVFYYRKTFSKTY